MLPRIIALLKNPRSIFTLATLGALGGTAVVLRLLTQNWLVISIALLSIVLVLLVVLLYRMVVLQERERTREAGVGDVEQAAQQRDEAGRRAAAGSLQDSVRDALATTRSRLGSVYARPWFLVLGERGSGKTTLLAESGLDLPAGHARTRVFGPTQSADIVLAEQSVMIDLSGRFLDGEKGDAGEWNALLRQLAGGRPDCPINGILFTLAASTLLGSSDEMLEEAAHKMRRRVNEVRQALGVDAPIYLVITKADLIEGFSEISNAMAQLKRHRSFEAFGWTNDRDVSVPEEVIARAFREISTRLDSGLAELLLREPDPTLRRRIFGFPQELSELTSRIVRFVGAAFKRSSYDTVPYLRGIYLTSALSQGDTLSTTLRRLGHEWALTRQSPSQRPMFLRDLFREIIAKDTQLAIPGSRLSGVSQRVAVGAVALLVVAALSTWGVSFYQNLVGSRKLSAAIDGTRSQDVKTAQLATLLGEIESAEVRAAGFVNKVGFRRLEGLTGAARASYVRSFDRNVDQPRLELIGRLLERQDEKAVKAAVTLSADLDWVSAHAQESSPPADFSELIPAMGDPKLGLQTYVAFVQWLSTEAWKGEVEERRKLLGGVASRFLDLGRLEAFTRSPNGPYPSIGYPDPLASGSERVAGIYTRKGFEGLVSQLLGAVQRSEAVDSGMVQGFKRQYASRFDDSWSRYLRDVPDSIRSQPDVKQSPYPIVLEILATHAALPVERPEGKVPAWVELMQRVKSETPGATDVLWPAYQDSLDNLGLETAAAMASGPRALEAVRSPNPFIDSLALVGGRAPKSKDTSATVKLRRLLELPTLDAFSAVLEAALRELDGPWRSRIADPYQGELRDQPQLAALYGPEGELPRIRSELLSIVYDDSGPKRLLRDLEAPFGRRFLDWMKNATNIQRTLFMSGGASVIPVRLSAQPARGLGDASGWSVRKRELELLCPDEQQKLEAFDGSPPRPFTFKWTAQCEELTLTITLFAAAQNRVERMQRVWRGPLALPNFLREGKPVGKDLYEWQMPRDDRNPTDREFGIPFFLLSPETAKKLRELAHLPPPASLRD